MKPLGRPKNDFARQTPVNELQRLAGRHQKILDLHLDGRTNLQISQLMKITPQSVGNIINSPIAQGEISRRRDSYQKAKEEQSVRVETNALDILNVASNDAARTQVELLDSLKPEVRQRSAMDILDRTGICRKTRVDTNSQEIHINLSADDLLRIQTAAIESGQKLLEVEAEVEVEAKVEVEAE